MPPPDHPLFTAADLEGWIGRAVTPERAATAERVVWGWLQPIVGGERPTEPSDTLFAYAIELGAIAYENPTGLSARQLGDENRQYSQERRAEILTEAAGTLPGGRGSAPRGRFPKARAYPDPVDRDRPCLRQW